jgi:hypothetical protein
MEELNEVMVEDTFENDVEFEDENSGIGGKIALGVAAIGVVGAGIAAFAAKKSGKLEKIKEARRQKKIEKLESKLEREYTKIEVIPEEEAKEEE